MLTNTLAFSDAPARSDAMDADIQAWVSGGLRLQKPSGSARHRLESPADIPAFVIQHDWASAFAGATDFDGGDFRCPYPGVYFEFRVSGRHVIVEIDEAEDATLKYMVFMVETRDGWHMPQEPYALSSGELVLLGEELNEEPDPFGPLMAMMVAQVRAVCISLEAEVASADVVAAPPRLNAARAKRGKPPLADYRVVRLNRAPRSYSVEGPVLQRHKRLHFRRGHWRHLASERRTWVRWCLVGDPDLGFIDKEYRL